MAKQRGSVARILLVFLSVLVLSSEMVAAETFVVGGSRGWTFNVSAWPYEKHFNVGDILEFNYNPKEHNVVIVDNKGYQECKASQTSKTYQTGHDQIKISLANLFVISSVDDDCLKGLKIAVRLL